MAQAKGTFAHLVAAHTELAKAHTKLRKQLNHERDKASKDMEAANRKVQEEERKYGYLYTEYEAERERANAATGRAQMWFDKYDKSRDARCEDNKRIGNLESELAAAKAELAAAKAKLAATEAVTRVTNLQQENIDALARDPKRRCLPSSFGK